MEPFEKGLGWQSFTGLLLAVLLAACSAETGNPVPAKKGSDFPAALDSLAPSTNLTVTPDALTNQPTAKFIFNGKDDIAIDRFECRLDAEVWKGCKSPQLYTGLATGAHRIAVRSFDTASNVDASPATWAWFIDRTPPETNLVSGPLSATGATSATFMFGGTDNVGVSGFECNRDGLGWGVCSSPVTYSNLATGAHSFHVRAGDTVGNADASPLEVAWSTYLPYPADPAACFNGGDLPQLDLFTGPATYWTWNDPHVIKTPAAYWMYASATSFFTFPVRLYRLTATDTTHWSFPNTEPVLADSTAGAWDAGGLETPAVVFFQGQYHLFYTGYPYLVGDPLHSALDYRIGHAMSADGVTFTRASSLPLVAPSGTTDPYSPDAWNAYIAAEPAPVVFNGELFLYFTTVGIDVGLGSNSQVIGVIRSSDGINWSTPELALKPDQTLYPRNQDWIGYSTPNAVVLNDTMHLFFDVAHQPDGGAWKQLRLHHAASPDGLTRWVHDAQPIRSAGDFVWAIDEIRSPHALQDGSNLRLYFAGHELNGVAPHYFGVGMMTCDLLLP